MIKQARGQCIENQTAMIFVGWLYVKHLEFREGTVF